MRLRYAGTCRICGSELARGSDAVYERLSRTVRCTTCGDSAAPPAVTIDPGVPGASARREFEWRQARREERIRGRHKRLGGLILALSEDPQSTRAWEVGATGEERLGARLNDLANESLRVLHDRRIPGGRTNIDHVVVTPAGVVVVDAKRYRGRPRLVIEGGLLRPRVEKLTVAGRDRTTLVDGVLKQVEAVRALLDGDIPVRGVLCFLDADWPLVGGSFSTRDVAVVWPRTLCASLQAAGPLSTAAVADVHGLLASRLRPS